MFKIIVCSSGDEFLATNSTVAFSPLQLHCVCQRMVIPIPCELMCSTNLSPLRNSMSNKPVLASTCSELSYSDIHSLLYTASDVANPSREFGHLLDFLQHLKQLKVTSIGYSQHYFISF